MNTKASVYIAMSLDGFIARQDGDLDWLDEASATVPAGEDCGYKDFMGSIDVLVLGRKSYEKVLSFGDWPYSQTRVVVLSSQPIEFPTKLPANVSHSSDSPAELWRQLSDKGAKHLYIDGGVTIQRFLAAGLIEELTITIIPILLGTGTPLFGQLPSDVLLTHLETRTFEFGFVQLRYRIGREES